MLVRMRTDRVLHRPVGPQPPDTVGRPRRHGDEFAFGDPGTWSEPDVTVDTTTRLYGPALIRAWDRLHPRLTHRIVWRLATANHISVFDLTRYLAGAPEKPLRPEWVAAASGWPLPILLQRIRGLLAEDQVSGHSGTVCRRCMAHRGVFERVVVCRPWHINVCLRHRLWVGDIHSPEEQFGLSDLPTSSPRNEPMTVWSAGTAPTSPTMLMTPPTESSGAGPNAATGPNTGTAG
ncbi:hypothetical protein GCM10022222_51320 [Amycolatopsis ultiminotia]|uniref:TniQ protein n=1 Tax=Amycolatopsis ultiminotia TaxID=543629 RepID=A0ABP6X5G9_9PSEU